MRWLRANAAKYNLDPDRFAAFGSSAGGHLVALLGTSGGVKELEGDIGGNLDHSSRVQAVCDLYGPTDLIAMVTTPGYEGHAKADSPESKMLGGAVRENKATAERANPITYISRETPPFLIIHGDDDPVVPPGQSRLLFEALKKAKIEVALQRLPGAKHGGPEFNTPETQKQVGDFFAKHLRPVAAATETKQETLPEQLAAPPRGFDQRRDSGEHGKLDTIEYDSTTVGEKRKAMVYTPPGLLPRREVSGALLAARDWRDGARMDARRRGRGSPGQSVRGQKSGPDDRCHAQRPRGQGPWPARSVSQAIAGLRGV